ncbi:MAG: hypothetical protein IGR76_10200 [Synechococcales cyanobacterium T60_A2020_003]|nr:hypothetical protein [Synechococcales cyanobacterium T60_A2020_003]
MPAHDQKTVTPDAVTSSPVSPSDAAIALTKASSPTYLQPAPLPGNRPVADNVTDDIDDLLGYLD